MRIEILSLFPDYFRGPFDVSILKRAREKGLLDLNLVDIRDFSEDKHRRVDDRPYGGGPGMLMTPGPCVRAIRSVKRQNSHVVYLSPKGSLLSAKKCQQLAEKEHLILLCGHYEGVDQRVIETEVDEEISIGSYVLTNGCLPAIVLVDGVSRFLPGVLGHEEAAYLESFQEGRLEAPQYTRPESFEGNRVPEVLLSGNHREIEKWRREKEIVIVGASDESTD